MIYIILSVLVVLALFLGLYLYGLRCNSRLKKHIRNCNCVVVNGDRGAGKSTLLALFVDVFKSLGYDIYCQYPYEGCYQIPLVDKKINGATRKCVDKEWLYTHDFSHSVVLLDEGKNIWPARGWAQWSQSDDDFFDFIRKTDTIVVICTLVFDALDLNVRRASDELIYLTPGFFNFSRLEISRTRLCKVADTNTEVVGSGSRGMRKIKWDVCEVPIGTYKFYRKPYYGKFLTLYTTQDKPKPVQNLWPSFFFRPDEAEALTSSDAGSTVDGEEQDNN